MKWGKLIAVVACAAALAGCSRTVMNVHNAPAPATIQSAQMVEQAILLAGQDLGWQMAQKSSGLIWGTLVLRGHTAEVAIPYSIKGYSILYRGSEKLDYDASDNEISRYYNDWVKSLNIQVQDYLKHPKVLVNAMTKSSASQARQPAIKSVTVTAKPSSSTSTTATTTPTAPAVSHTTATATVEPSKAAPASAATVTVAKTEPVVTVTASTPAQSTTKTMTVAHSSSTTTAPVTSSAVTKGGVPMATLSPAKDKVLPPPAS